MSILDIIFMAVGLAMDCLAVSIATGISQGYKSKMALRMAVSFGVFQAMMPFVGFLAGYYFRETIASYSGWIALVILGLLGANMIREDFFSKDKDTPAVNPNKWMGIILLSVATSIDALATGVMFTSFSSRRLCIALLIIGAVSFLFSEIGSRVGAKCGNKFKFHADSIGGLILISIGVKIFVEHYYM